MQAHAVLVRFGEVLNDVWRWALRALRIVMLPLIVALPSLPWVLEATRRASLEALGRDQGIFQYVGWAVAHGSVDYKDIRDVNGPLTHLVHLVFLALGGADEHRFRELDFTVSGAVFALIGASLPGLSRASLGAGPRALERVAWGFAGWTLLSAQYLRYTFWDLAQRESFFDWFMLASIALQLAALSPGVRPRLSAALLAVSGVLSVVPWFGKPTYFFFTATQLLTLAIAETYGKDARRERASRFIAFAAGGAVGATTQLAYLVVYADIGAFARIYFLDVPHLYRFIWPRTAIDSLGLPGASTIGALAIVASLSTLGLIVDGQLPRRALAVALVPLAGLASVILQAKGFLYHFHPVSAGLYLQGLVLVMWLSEQMSGPFDGIPLVVTRLLRLVPPAAAATLGIGVVLSLLGSPHLDNWWILQKGVTPELRQSRDYFAYFRTQDYFPWDMRQAAHYLDEHTEPNDTVQLYGMDPYLLFLARRKSATPYIYAYDLDVDTALTGSALPEGVHPTAFEAERIRTIRDEHERDFLERIQAHPPAAFVFMDRSPLITDDDAWLDFATHNDKSAGWVREHYKQTAAFGDDCIWLRTDLSADLPEVPRSHESGGE
jgi:hypothetical protein